MEKVKGGEAQQDSTREEACQSQTHEVKQELPTQQVVLDQMSCDVHGVVGRKGHQEIRARNRQCATCGEKEERL